MLTAIINFGLYSRAISTAILSITPPSTKVVPYIFTGSNIPGIAHEAFTDDAIGPAFKATETPFSRSVVTATNGIFVSSIFVTVRCLLRYC